MVRSIACGIWLLAAFLITRRLSFSPATAAALFAPAYLLGGFDTTRQTIRRVAGRRFHLDIDTLMIVAAAAAGALGEWAEGAFLLFLFSMSNALEEYALDRARNAIRALSALAPATACVRHDGGEVAVAVEQVAVGDVVVVRPGERIPVDGVVVSGRSAVDQSPITGESVPVDKAPGSDVFAGTINGEGAIDVRTSRALGDRTLDRVIRLVEEAQAEKAPTQRFTERFERVFVPIVLGATALIIVLPPLVGLLDWTAAFYRATTLLVGASPCAVALGTPAAVLVGIAQAARRGVLIKGGGHLENLAELKAIAFDKTGTLTVGKPEVVEVEACEGAETGELLRIAAGVEDRSRHPLAVAVVRHARARGVVPAEAGELTSITGRGVRSAVEGQTVEIGSARMWEDATDGIPEALRRSIEAACDRGRTVMAVRHGGRWLGLLGLSDLPRSDVQANLEALRSLGVRPLVMLTGDHARVGEAIGSEVGIDEVVAGLLPEEKVVAIKRLLERYGRVGMVGDGVNDAPALATATIGIAMGGAGTAVALETADVALMADDLSKLPYAIRLARATKAVIRQNVAIALGVIVVLILSALTGRIGIGTAVFCHEGSTLVVLANALRLFLHR